MELNSVNKLKIAITGNIGSGKSTVCKIFEILKIPVYCSDIRAMVLSHIKPEIISVYKQIFGDDVYSYGFLDRKKVSETLFKQKELLKKVEDVVHPAIIEDFEYWCEEIDSPIVLFESALLFEKDIYKFFDKNILVTAPENIRINRVMKRDNLSEQDVIYRIDNQWSEEKKIPLSNYIIINDDTTAVIPQVLELYKKFTELQNIIL